MDDFLYTYKDSYFLVKKYGLLSLFGLYNYNLFDEFLEGCKKYLERGKLKNIISFKEIKKDPKRFFELYQKINGKNSHKSIWFLFDKITPGISKRRDKFAKSCVLVKVPLNNFRSNWTYYIRELPSSGHSLREITYKQMLNLKEGINQELFEKKYPNERFLFSFIPHLAISPPDGKISVNKIIIER